MRELLIPCTVRLTTPSQKGTGFFVAPGLILTCSHVIEHGKIESQDITVEWANKTLPVLTLDWFNDESLDIALIYVGFVEHGYVELDVEPKLGDRLSSYGYPGDQRSGGSISFTCRGLSDGDSFISMEGDDARDGFSGSPVWNHRTLKVCAILTKRIEQGDPRFRSGTQVMGGLGISVKKLYENLKYLQQINYTAIEELPFKARQFEYNKARQFEVYNQYRQAKSEESKSLDEINDELYSHYRQVEPNEFEAFKLHSLIELVDKYDLGKKDLLNQLLDLENRRPSENRLELLDYTVKFYESHNNFERAKELAKQIFEECSLQAHSSLTTNSLECLGRNYLHSINALHRCRRFDKVINQSNEFFSYFTNVNQELYRNSIICQFHQFICNYSEYILSLYSKNNFEEGDFYEDSFNRYFREYLNILESDNQAFTKAVRQLAKTYLYFAVQQNRSERSKNYLTKFANSFKEYPQLRQAYEIEDWKWTAKVYYLTAGIYFRERNFEGAKNYFEYALKIYSKCGDEYGKGISNLSIGYIVYLQGKQADAEKYFEHSIEFLRDLLETNLESALCKYCLFISHYHRSNYVQAEYLLQEALRLYEKANPSKQNLKFLLEELSEEPVTTSCYIERKMERGREIENELRQKLNQEIAQLPKISITSDAYRRNRALCFRAKRVDERLIQHLRVSSHNQRPGIPLRCQWHIISDSDYSQTNHEINTWIFFNAMESKEEYIEYEIVINTDKLASGKKYKRKIELKTNFSTRQENLEVETIRIKYLNYWHLLLTVIYFSTLGVAPLLPIITSLDYIVKLFYSSETFSFVVLASIFYLIPTATFIYSLNASFALPDELCLVNKFYAVLALVGHWSLYTAVLAGSFQWLESIISFFAYIPLIIVYIITLITTVFVYFYPAKWAFSICQFLFYNSAESGYSENSINLLLLLTVGLGVGLGICGFSILQQNDFLLGFTLLISLVIGVLLIAKSVILGAYCFHLNHRDESQRIQQ